MSVDPAAYRDPAELAAALKTDPIARARAAYLALPGAQMATLDTIDAEVAAEVQAALDAAEAAPWPDPAAAFTDVQTTGAGVWE